MSLMPSEGRRAANMWHDRGMRYCGVLLMVALSGVTCVASILVMRLVRDLSWDGLHYNVGWFNVTPVVFVMWSGIIVATIAGLGTYLGHTDTHRRWWGVLLGVFVPAMSFLAVVDLLATFKYAMSVKDIRTTDLLLLIALAPTIPSAVGSGLGLGATLRQWRADPTRARVRQRRTRVPLRWAALITALIASCALVAIAGVAVVGMTQDHNYLSPSRQAMLIAYGAPAIAGFVTALFAATLTDARAYPYLLAETVIIPVAFGIGAWDAMPSHVFVHSLPFMVIALPPAAAGVMVGALSGVGIASLKS